jgi:hypothetical protein
LDKKNVVIGWSNDKERRDFIHNTESSIYTGINEDGEDVVVMLDKGRGMDVKTVKKTKPKWYEIIEYDEDGFNVGVRYEPRNVE